MDKIKEVRTLRYSNATIRVMIPDLTPGEYTRRHKQLEQAVIELLKSADDAENCISGSR